MALPSVALRLALVPVLLLAGVGCGSNLRAMKTGIAAGGPPLAFWPPPEPTGLEIAPTTPARAGARLVEEAARVGAALRDAGYRDARWYAIGPRYAHGFVLTTRLERVDARGAPDASDARWSPSYPDAANIFWLEFARNARLPAAGTFRVFLVAFTDLPMGASNQADPWREDTCLFERDRDPGADLEGDPRDAPATAWASSSTNTRPRRTAEAGNPVLKRCLAVARHPARPLWPRALTAAPAD